MVTAVTAVQVSTEKLSTDDTHPNPAGSGSMQKRAWSPAAHKSRDMNQS